MIKEKVNSQHTVKFVHKVNSLTVYEVKEEEIEIIKGGPRTRYQRLFEGSLFLLGIFVTCVLTIISSVKDFGETQKISFYCIGISSLLLGLILFILWKTIKRDDSFQKTIDHIINRNKPNEKKKNNRL